MALLNDAFHLADQILIREAMAFARITFWSKVKSHMPKHVEFRHTVVEPMDPSMASKPSITQQSKLASSSHLLCSLRAWKATFLSTSTAKEFVKMIHATI